MNHRKKEKTSNEKRKTRKKEKQIKTESCNGTNKRREKKSNKDKN